MMKVAGLGVIVTLVFAGCGSDESRAAGATGGAAGSASSGGAGASATGGTSGANGGGDTSSETESGGTGAESESGGTGAQSGSGGGADVGVTGGGGNASLGGAAGGGGSAGSCESATACKPREPGTSLADGTCSADGWCWVEPHPHGHALFDLDEADGHLWAVGEGGTVVHRGPNGAFKTEQWPELPALQGVEAVEPEDVWVVGQRGLILHFAQGAWSSIASPTDLDLRAIHAFANNDIWAAGGNDTSTEGVVLHYDGSEWKKVTTNIGVSSVHAIGGTSSRDLYLGCRGFHGSLVHYNGDKWRYVSELTIRIETLWQNFTSIQSFGGDLFVSSDMNDGRIWRLHEGKWGYLDIGERQEVYALAATGDALLILGTRSLRSYDGATFEELMRFAAPGRGTVVASPKGVWAAGQGGRIFERNGTAFELVYGSSWPGAGTSGFLMARAANDLWWVGRSTLRYDGERWIKSTFPGPLNSQAVWAGSKDVWATSSERVLRWNGDDWEVVYTAGDYLSAIWQSPSGKIWAGGRRVLVHFDGSSWSEVTDAGNVSGIDAIHGSADDNVWFVGSKIALRYDGSNWHREWPSEFGNDWLTAVHVLGPNSVWAGGANHRLYHFDGKGWTSYESHIPWIQGIQAFSEKDVWAVGGEAGTHGFITRFDGERWVRQRTGCARPLGQLYKQDEDTLWAGGDGALLRWVRP